MKAAAAGVLNTGEVKRRPLRLATVEGLAWPAVRGKAGETGADGAQRDFRAHDPGGSNTSTAASLGLAPEFGERGIGFPSATMGALELC